MKKFYKLVSLSAAPPPHTGWTIHLDNKPVKTPSRVLLIAPTKKLAQEIAIEWQQQKNNIIPESMPLTQILTTAQDYIAAERPAVTEKTLSYLDTDLLCYRTEKPPALAEYQSTCWNPWLSWFQDTYNTTLQTTNTLIALTQPKKAHDAVTHTIQTMNNYEFTALQFLTSLTGSLILALAFVAGKATPSQLYDAATVEESYKATIYNEKKYGADPLQEKKQDALKRDLEAVKVFLDSI